MRNLTLIIISLFISLTLQVMAKESIFGFDTAKRKLYRNVYQNWGETFYCSCNWYNKKIDLQSCGLQSYFPKKQRKRSSRTEAEHIIPASWILKVDGKYRQCVVDAKKEGEIARKYCRKHENDFFHAFLCTFSKILFRRVASQFRYIFYRFFTLNFAFFYVVFLAFFSAIFLDWCGVG